MASALPEAFGESSATVGLDNADFGILAALRRAGPDHAVTPTELARRRMMTSGGMTAAIDRLDRRGLVDPIPNPTDRRGSLVRVTDVGREAIDQGRSSCNRTSSNDWSSRSTPTRSPSSPSSSVDSSSPSTRTTRRAADGALAPS